MKNDYFMLHCRHQAPVVSFRVLSNPSVISYADGPYPGDVVTGVVFPSKERRWDETNQRFIMCEVALISTPAYTIKDGVRVKVENRAYTKLALGLDIERI